MLPCFLPRGRTEDGARVQGRALQRVFGAARRRRGLGQASALARCGGLLRRSRCGASRPPERRGDLASLGPPRLRARWLPDGMDSAASARDGQLMEASCPSGSPRRGASFSGGRASEALAFSQAFPPVAGRSYSPESWRCHVSRAAQHAAGADRPRRSPTGAPSVYTSSVGLPAWGAFQSGGSSAAGRWASRERQGSSLFPAPNDSKLVLEESYRCELARAS